MRSEKFHAKGTLKSPIVVDECSRLTVNGTEPVNVYQVDDQGKKAKLLQTGQNFKIKLHDVEEIVMESKGDFNSILEGPDPLDTTPIEVPVEAPLSQAQQIRAWLQNQDNIQASARHELTWEEFKDLGDLDEGDEFYGQFGQEGMTKYEMQGEALRQHQNPLRGLDLNETSESISDNGSGKDDQSQPMDDNGAQNSGEAPTEANKTTDD